LESLARPFSREADRLLPPSRQPWPVHGVAVKSKRDDLPVCHNVFKLCAYMALPLGSPQPLTIAKRQLRNPGSTIDESTLKEAAEKLGKGCTQWMR